MPCDIVVIAKYNEEKKKGTLPNFLRQGATFPPTLPKYEMLLAKKNKTRTKLINSKLEMLSVSFFLKCTII